MSKPKKCDECDICGKNGYEWGLNYPCRRTDVPAFENNPPRHAEVPATSLGFSPGDIVRNAHGHVAIVTFANNKWGDIKCRLRGKTASEYVSLAGDWRVIKKASPAQAKRWLAVYSGMGWNPGAAVGEPKKKDYHINMRALRESIEKLLSEEKFIELFSKKIDLTPIKKMTFDKYNDIYFLDKGLNYTFHKYMES